MLLFSSGRPSDMVSLYGERRRMYDVLLPDFSNEVSTLSTAVVISVEQPSDEYATLKLVQRLGKITGSP